MGKLKIVSVVGARPNFMKIAPFIHTLNKYPNEFEHLLVHTGQHYDQAMSLSFFEALNIPRPDVDLEIGSGSHAEQVGKTMMAFEKVVQDWKPDWVVVVGDVNATCACSITAKKEHVKLAHIEAGLRSFDLDMPEEINRMVTDRLSDVLFTPDEIAGQQLLKEGASPEQISFVGNIMIDTLMKHKEKAASLSVYDIISSNLIEGQSAVDVGGNFGLLTMHRPSNVDNPDILVPLVETILSLFSEDMPLVWSIHPRTRKQLQRFNLWDRILSENNVILVCPLTYHEMLKMNMSAAIMMTDSGGLQEECCLLGTPCITMRENTERPITLKEHGGVSILTGSSPDKIRQAFKEMESAQRAVHAPRNWDGNAAERIVGYFRRLMHDKR